MAWNESFSLAHGCVGTAQLQLEVRWRCAPPVSRPAGRGHQSMCLRWHMAGRLVTEPNNMRTHKTLGQVWLYDIHLHTAGPKAPRTPKPEVGKGSNCTGWGGVGRRRVTCNTLHLLASETLLLLLLLSRLLFHQISLLHFVQALVQSLPHQRSFLIFPWDRDQESSHALTLILPRFHS